MKKLDYYFINLTEHVGVDTSVLDSFPNDNASQILGQSFPVSVTWNKPGNSQAIVVCLLSNKKNVWEVNNTPPFDAITVSLSREVVKAVASQHNQMGTNLQCNGQTDMKLCGSMCS